MKTKIQIKSYYGNVLFEFEKEDNSIKQTLEEAIRQRVCLREADLREADLQRADLQGAYLQGAYLRKADLRGADLQRADLRGAYLQGAYLQGAFLQGAFLREADLEKIRHLFTILPEGKLIVWKKLRDGYVAKLLIPTEAKRVNALSSRKCRFEYAKVIKIYSSRRKIFHGEVAGLHDSTFMYKEGKTVRPNSFNDSPLIECTNGIHAFITRKEAEEYEG